MIQEKADMASHDNMTTSYLSNVPDMQYAIPRIECCSDAVPSLLFPLLTCSVALAPFCER